MGDFDAVIFDNDGVLIDIEVSDPAIFVDVVRQAFGDFGVEPDESEIAEFVGYAHLDVDRMRSICNDYDVDFEELWRRRELRSSEIQRRELERGRSLYDDVDVVERIEVSMGVVSNNQQRTVDYVVSHFGLDSYFDAVYAREASVEAIEKGKPNPHYIERCIDELGCENPVYVGDTETDMMAANDAGIASAYLDRPHTAKIDESVDLELDSLYELTEILES